MEGATGDLATYVGHNWSSTINYIMAPRHLSEYVVRVNTGGYTALNTSDHVPIKVLLSVEMLPHAVKIPRQPRAN